MFSRQHNVYDRSTVHGVYKTFQAVFGPSFLHSSRLFTNGTMTFTSAEWRVMTVAVVIVLWSLLLKTTLPSWSVWTKKTHAIQKTRWKTAGTTEAVHPTVTEEQKRGRAELCRHMFKNLTEVGQIGWLLYTSISWKPSIGFQPAFFFIYFLF